jgi:RNA ligase (TIGR02306 family)
MSKFECPVVRVTIEPHPNADSIELALIAGYTCIVKKGQFKTGDLAVYLPEQAVLPEWLLKSLGFWNDLNSKGTLAGSAGNRIKAIRLRGIFSQGVLIDGLNGARDTLLIAAPADNDKPEIHVWADAEEGSDLSEFLSVIKYEPIVPVSMQARVAGGDLDATIGYDFDNLKKHPHLFSTEQEVVVTEKLHGTLLQVGLIPRSIWEGKSWADKCPDFGDYKGVVTSKGQGAKGLLIDPSDQDNLYVKTVMKAGLWQSLHASAQLMFQGDYTPPLFLFGEIVGIGVQDLGYGFPQPEFRAFDMYVGTRTAGQYVSFDTFQEQCSGHAISMVPLLYRGPFDMDKVLQLTNGNTVVLVDGMPVKQIREGVVVRDVRSSEHRHKSLGRYIAKSVSEAYLLRKGEVTEYQ